MFAHVVVAVAIIVVLLVVFIVLVPASAGIVDVCVVEPVVISGKIAHQSQLLASLHHCFLKLIMCFLFKGSSSFQVSDFQ